MHQLHMFTTELFIKQHTLIMAIINFNMKSVYYEKIELGQNNLSSDYGKNSGL